MLIAIDHGNYAVKTPRFSFISGLSEHAVKPPLADEVLEYEGKYWTLSGKRLPYMRDKRRALLHFVALCHCQGTCCSGQFCGL